MSLMTNYSDLDGFYQSHRNANLDTVNSNNISNVKIVDRKHRKKISHFHEIISWENLNFLFYAYVRLKHKIFLL